MNLPVSAVLTEHEVQVLGDSGKRDIPLNLLCFFCVSK